MRNNCVVVGDVLTSVKICRCSVSSGGVQQADHVGKLNVCLFYCSLLFVLLVNRLVFEILGWI